MVIDFIQGGACGFTRVCLNIQGGTCNFTRVCLNVQDGICDFTKVGLSIQDGTCDFTKVCLSVQGDIWEILGLFLIKMGGRMWLVAGGGFGQTPAIKSSCFQQSKKFNKRNHLHVPHKSKSEQYLIFCYQIICIC